MKVYVPYTRLADATRIALAEYDTVDVALDYGDTAYWRYFADRWEEGQGFVNVEHDCVPWPGAIDQLVNCEQDWCAFNYHLKCHQQTRLLDNPAVPLGCVKFSASFIRQTPLMWRQTDPEPWSYVDRHITSYARSHGLNVHEHHPGIVNANPAFLMVDA